MDVFKHYTVMLNEAVDALECQDGKIYVDCTLGGGGHSELILKRISPNGKLISFDIDDEAIAHASKRLENYDNLTIVKSSYTNIKSELKKLGIEKKNSPMKKRLWKKAIAILQAWTKWVEALWLALSFARR